MTILVTGGAGYIGSHNVLELLKNGLDVVIFDNITTGNEKIVDILTALNYKGKVVEFIKGDLLEKEKLSKVFQKHKITAVMHFASYSIVEESVFNPQKYYMNNVVGSINLFDAMLENNIKHIIFSSSASTYGTPLYTPINEKHPQNPINPYGKTKLMAEKILDDYDRAFGLKSIRLRYFNVTGANSDKIIGEAHNPETHLIPNIVKSALYEDKTFYLFGNDYETKDGTCVRDFINIEDLACAHLLALKYLEENNETNFFNIGTKEGNSVQEVFETCEKILNRKINIEVKEKRAGDPPILVADNKKAQALLGWSPKKTLADSIKSTYEWEKKLHADSNYKKVIKLNV